MELELVERVELRLLLADSDEKLSAALVNFLCPLLQKLASTNVEVVRKVAEVLKFVKMKKNGSRDVAFPLDKLVDLYEKHIFDVSPGAVRQNRQVLSFIGLELSTRNDVEALPLLDKFAYGLRNDNIQDNEYVGDNVAEQFSLFLFALNAFSEGHSGQSVAADIKLLNWNEEDVTVLQKRLAQLFLLDPKKPPAAQQPLLAPKDVSFFLDHNDKNGIRFMPDSDAGITHTRKSALKLAHSFPEQLKYVLVAAMGDQMLDISRQARADVLKLRDFDSELLQKWIIHGNDLLSMEAINVFTRQRSFETAIPDVVLAPFSRGDLKLRLASLRLLRDLAQAEVIKSWDPSICSKVGRLLHQYIIDDGWPKAQVHSAIQTQLRQLCYELLGAFTATKTILTFLFQSLERDSPDMAQPIQKSLSWMLQTDSHVEVDAQKLLQFMQTSRSNRTRYSVVKFATSQLDPALPVQKIICMLGVDPTHNRSDVIAESQRGLLTDSNVNLPSFTPMLDDVNAFLDFTNASQEVVNTTLMYLFACLVRYTPDSSNWVSDLSTSLSLSESPLDASIKDHISEFLPFLQLLFSFLTSQSYYEVVPMLLRKILLILSDDERAKLASSGIIDINSLMKTLQSESNGYGSFVAEYVSQVAPIGELSASSTKLEVLAQAFRAATLNEPAKELVDLAVETKNVEAVKVLAVSGLINPNDSKVTESPALKAQMVLACLSVHADPEKRSGTLDELLKSVPTSFDDIVANGEAISVVCSGWRSKVLVEGYPFLAKQMTSVESNTRNLNLEQHALKSVVSGIRGSPETRRIASVRLLCLTQYSFYDIEKFPGIASGIQSCFMSLLSDSDEVTQESAGRGLSILFENSNGDSQLQNSLLSMLLSSFTDDRTAKQHTAGNLTADTQVFEPGVLPSGPREKQSISTYKDVLNLANETGDSSLVYKFMSLSASSQIWTGRKGIAFSLEQILAKSQLNAQTATRSDLGTKLIPKLFRYLYDPVEGTKQAMKHIWSALVPTTRRSQTIRLYLPEISEEIKKGVVDREWRVREASVNAISDLVSQGYLEDTIELWKAGFRAVDDIKESVTTAGSELLKTLTNSLVRTNSMGKPTDLNEIVPFLVKGLSNESTVKFSVETLLKLSETSGFKPWAAGLVEELTLQLSSLEPQALNYLALNMNQGMIDSVRSEGLRNSPIMRGIESMVDRGFVSTDEMWEILPRIVKKAVGVSSKAASARLIILTCMQTYGASKHGTEQLLKAAFHELWGNNDFVSEKYAAAMGYLCRQLPLSLLVLYTDALKAKFLASEADDDRIREIIGVALKDFSNNASDAFASISSSVLPLAFVGKFTAISDKSTSKANPFQEVWESNTGGSLSLRLYFDEIFRFCQDILKDSSVRGLKVAASKAVSEVVSQSQLGRSDVNNKTDTIVQMTKSLLAALAGRSWPDKQFLFEALVALYPLLDEEKEKSLRTQVEERVLNEIQRRNLDYKMEIIPTVSRFVKSFEGSDKAPEALPQIEELLADGFIEIATNDNDKTAEAFRSTFSVLDSSELNYKVVNHVLSERNWKFRVIACEVLQEKPFDEHLWQIITDKCADDEQFVKVRSEWCKAAAKFKEHPVVAQNVQTRLQNEKSTVIRDQLNAI